MKTFVVAGFLALGAAAARAEGCPPDGGIAIDTVEAMNQMILENDFSGFSVAIKEKLGIDPSGGFGEIETIFKDGFTGCATVAQRTEVGGLVQNLVVFNGKRFPLYGYWLAIPEGAGYRVLSFNINTSLDQVAESFR